MYTWRLFLLFSLGVGAARCLHVVKRPTPDLVCQVNLYPELSEAILEKLDACSYVIVSYESLCDLARPLRNFTDGKRIELIRQKAPRAKILRQVVIEMGADFDPNKAVQQVEISLPRQVFDGVELSFDPSLLDQSGQIKYAQFLKLLKRKLGESALISNSIVCNEPLPAFLLNAMNEAVDFVILDPVLNSTVSDSVLAPRVYTDSIADCLLNAKLPRAKVVLGLPSGGNLVNSLKEQEPPSRLIPYGNVCELFAEQQRHCQENGNPNCSLFEEGVKLIYDDPNSASGRALQSIGCQLKGISIGLNYDDQKGICLGSSFPLLVAVQNVFKRRMDGSRLPECPSNLKEYFEYSDEAYDPPCDSQDGSEANSDEAEDCCSVHGKSCNGCHLLNRLQGTVKTSEQVVKISKSVADKVLGSLDRVVDLVSSMLQNNPVELPVSPPELLVSSLAPIPSSVPVLGPVISPLIASPLLSPILGPILQPPVSPVPSPILSPVLGPLKPVVDPILPPIVSPVLDPLPALLNPVVDPILPPIVQPIPSVASNSAFSSILDPIIPPVLDPVVGPILDPLDPILTPLLPPVFPPMLPPIVGKREADFQKDHSGSENDKEAEEHKNSPPQPQAAPKIGDSKPKGTDE